MHCIGSYLIRKHFAPSLGQSHPLQHSTTILFVAFEFLRIETFAVHAFGCEFHDISFRHPATIVMVVAVVFVVVALMTV